MTGLIARIVEVLHELPRYNFKFTPTDSTFLPHKIEYLQGVSLWVIGYLCIGVLLTVITVISWSYACCRKRREPAKRLTQIRNLSSWLFIISLLCFVWVGTALYGNEQVNHSVISATEGLDDLSYNNNRVKDQLTELNTTLEDIKSELVNFVHQLNNATKLLKNETAVKPLHMEIKSVSHAVDNSSMVDEKMYKEMVHLSGVHNISINMTDLEFKRWIIGVVFLSVIMAVIFCAVVGFCRHSKKSSVIFSGVGLFVFMIVWFVGGLSVGSSLLLADFCSDPSPYLISQMQSNHTKTTVNFYLKCNKTSDDASPFLQQCETNLEDFVDVNMPEFTKEARTIIGAVFEKNETQGMELSLSSLDKIIRTASKSVSVVTSQITCKNVRNDLDKTTLALCHNAVIGVVVLLSAVILVGLTIFILLQSVSKAWHLYTKRPLDYREVDEEDPFMPRSTIPADFYGTHMFNPRTRFASASNDSDDNSTPLWARSTIPSTTRPPPAYDSVGLSDQ